jgi:protein phosphatase
VQEIPLTADGTVTLAVASLTDVGRKRKNNQDSCGIFPASAPGGGAVLVVADGMGGAAGGEVASALAVETIHARTLSAAGDRPADDLRAAITAANAAIHGRASEDPQLTGMGTTCTVAALRGSELWFGHVGDSRLYVAEGGSLRQLSRDHTVAAERARQGGGGESPRGRNVLTRCLGVKPTVEPDVTDSPLRVEAQTTVILCSDGLSNLVQDDEILFAVSMHLPEGACKRLVQLACERGAPDNVTVIVGRVNRR